MKNLLFALIIQVIFVFGLKAQTINWESITIEENAQVKGIVNGFNMGGYAYGRINNQSSNITVPSECNQCGSSLPLISGPSYSSMQTKENVITQTAKIKPGALRFPGGTHSGWYHLYNYNNQGFYDAASPEIKKGYGMTVIEAGHLNNPLSYCRADSRVTVEQNFIDGFINYVLNVQDATPNSEKIKVTYVANLLTHFRFAANQTIYSSCGRSKATEPMEAYDCTSTFNISYEGNEALFGNNPDIYRFELYYKETQDAIEKIVDGLDLESDDVLFVEMGNEYYSTSGYPYSKYQMDVHDYSDLVEIYSERLKCYFSDKVEIKTGMVTKPNTTWQEELSSNLSSDITADGKTLNDNVDAVIFHDYYTKSSCLEETDILSRFDCAKDELTNHIEIDLNANLDQLQDDFPSQKIWITEWNIVGGTDGKNNSYINTILHATWVQEYVLGILSYNASHADAVELMTHHRIGDHNLWSVVQTKEGDNSEANFRSGGYAMQFLNKLYAHENIHMLGDVLENDSDIFDTKEAKVVSFVQFRDENNTTDKIILYFSNKTASNISYELPSSIDSILVQEATISILQGDHLFTYGSRNTTAGKNRFDETSNITHNNEALNTLGYGDIDDEFNSSIDSTININSSHNIPSNSMGVIEIVLDKIPINTHETESKNITINVFPNPTSESFKLSIDSKTFEEYELQLLSGIGDELNTQEIKIQSGNNEFEFDSSQLPTGLYYIILKNKRNTVIKKVIVL